MAGGAGAGGAGCRPLGAGEGEGGCPAKHCLQRLYKQNLTAVFPYWAHRRVLYKPALLPRVPHRAIMRYHGGMIQSTRQLGIILTNTISMLLLHGHTAKTYDLDNL